MPSTSRDGVDIWWDERGASTGGAEVVVLVPGRGDSSDIWPPELLDPLVAASFRVLVFDPRGTGRSSVSEGYDLAAMADDVVAVVDAAGARRVHLVCLSMGGLLTIDLATRYAGRCGALAFLSAMSPDTGAGFGPQFFDQETTDPVEALLAAMESPSSDDRAWVAARIASATARAPIRSDAAERHQDAVFRSEFPSADLLAEITAPVLVIHGRDDQVLPVAHAEALAAGIPDSRLVLLDAMGHIPRPAQWSVVADAVVAHLCDATITDDPAG